MVEQGEIVGKVSGRGVLLQRMRKELRKESRSVIDGGDRNPGVINEVFAGLSRIRGRPPAIGLVFAWRGSMADHANWDVRKV
eukprot:6198994-Pleurochrysis_carterae.AAC.6